MRSIAHHIFMKKFYGLIIYKLALSFLVVICCTLGASQCSAFAETRLKPLQTVAVTDSGNAGKASLYAQGQNYKTDVKLTVEFKNHKPYDIRLQDGYSQAIYTFDFGAQDKFLFYSSQTGGSGGYGNYRIYRLQTETYKLLYDDKTDSKNAVFKTEFIPNGFMKIYNEASHSGLDVYVNYIDKSFYDEIFAPDDSVKNQTPYVNDISFVSPSLNSSSGIWRLLTYRSVTAVAEVNRLGYIVQTLDYENGTFTPTFTEFCIDF